MNSELIPVIFFCLLGLGCENKEKKSLKEVPPPPEMTIPDFSIDLPQIKTQGAIRLRSKDGQNQVFSYEVRQYQAAGFGTVWTEILTQQQREGFQSCFTNHSLVRSVKDQDEQISGKGVSDPVAELPEFSWSSNFLAFVVANPSTTCRNTEGIEEISQTQYTSWFDETPKSKAGSEVLFPEWFLKEEIIPQAMNLGTNSVVLWGENSNQNKVGVLVHVQTREVTGLILPRTLFIQKSAPVLGVTSFQKISQVNKVLISDEDERIHSATTQLAREINLILEGLMDPLTQEMYSTPRTVDYSGDQLDRIILSQIDKMKTHLNGMGE